MVGRLRNLALALLAAASLLQITVTQSRAETFVLDRDHTEVRASWDHLGISRQSANFNDVIGRVEFSPDRPEQSSVDITIKVASISTGVPALDKHLKETTDFFDVNKYPNITFRSRSVAMTSAKSANIEGDLTINGITKPVTLSAVWNFLGEHPLANVNPVYKDVQAAGFSARTQILRSEWGISRTIPLVSDEIRITIEVEMLKRP
ncbi:YceI-like domain protein [Candidatus Filomicrobium marinum]|uniref:YceI-like domain protein n=2 Tax=Filomicrobium TaxID=119044 RepID=A0A0D6JIA9_9HYPH|nr:MULTISPECIES: YceI family protein [Filomicrobium]MCV0369458.1 YceI family protein [Filomicrobium sp.]CFX43098.1 YceI-like domain protein [Candidatus Filomicrobium marinum]CPR21005.1 YceI-like domain protein [Candidatus Filomicrobium marinum]SDP22260.1 Polyisoprenoid-binding protein YceI [Filomicrobium insigne]